MHEIMKANALANITRRHMIPCQESIDSQSNGTRLNSTTHQVHPDSMIQLFPRTRNDKKCNSPDFNLCLGK